MRPLTLKALKALNRTVGPLLPPGLLARTYPQGRIHVDDQMLRSEAPEDVRHYFNTVVKERDGRAWKDFHDARELLP